MTLEVTLVAPYSNFPAVAGFQLFFPVPAGGHRGRRGLGERDHDRQRSLRDGGAPHRRGDHPRQERRPGPATTTARPGTTGSTRSPSARPPTPTPRTTRSRPARATPPTSRPARVAGRRRTTTAPRSTSPILGSYHFVINDREPAHRRRREPEAPPGHLGGDRPRGDQRGRLQRQPHDLHRHHAEGHPGLQGRPVRVLRLRRRSRPRRCSTSGRPTATRRPSRSRSSSTPTPATSTSSRSSSTTSPPSASRPSATPMDSETYFSRAALRAACVICRAGWFADYPTYDNFMFDLFHSDAARRQQLRLHQRGVRRPRRRGQADRRPRRRRPRCSRRPRRSC